MADARPIATARPRTGRFAIFASETGWLVWAARCFNTRLWLAADKRL